MGPGSPEVGQIKWLDNTVWLDAARSKLGAPAEPGTIGFRGVPEDEGRQLVRELIDHCTQPDFVYRHNWRVGDLVIWDNCSSLHRANSKDYELPYRRRMHRTTLTGSVPF